jgi:hypothetical protein
MADGTEQSTFAIISQKKPSKQAHTQNSLCGGGDEHQPIYEGGSKSFQPDQLTKKKLEILPEKYA